MKYKLSTRKVLKDLKDWNEKRLFSIEFMPPIIDGSPGANWPVIINYGFRW